MKRTKWIAFLCFAFLMAGLGANDALRGIFAPVFQERYDLNGSQLSLIVTISYVGNLLFLSIGGKLLDLFPRKNVAVAVTAVWAGAVALNLVSDSYIWILVSMFFALGASTLLNTTVNILTPAVFAGYAGLMVNVLFFIQGIGTSGSQLLLGRYAFHYAGWKWINAALLTVAFLVIVLFFFLKIPKQGEEKEREKEILKKEPDSKIFWIFIAMMGCYFIGEHGIMNWLMSYCISAFSMEPVPVLGRHDGRTSDVCSRGSENGRGKEHEALWRHRNGDVLRRLYPGRERRMGSGSIRLCAGDFVSHHGAFDPADLSGSDRSHPYRRYHQCGYGSRYCV